MDPTNSTPDSALSMEMNGEAAVASTSMEAAETEVSNPAPAPKTYDDLFPSLPMSAGKGHPGPGNPIGEWNRKPILQSSVITQILSIPMAERRAMNGTGTFGGDEHSKTLKNVMDKSGAKIEMSASKDQSLTFLITGKQDAVLKARRELFAQFQTQLSTTISIPKEHHRFIFGKGGSRLLELEQRTATKISIPKAGEATDKITVTGPKECIDKAVHEINIISDQQSKQTYEVLPILKIYHPFVNGPNGEHVKKLMAEHANVKINIPPLGVYKDEISVAGEKESVLKVVAIINKIAKDMVRLVQLVFLYFFCEDALKG